MDKELVDAAQKYPGRWVGPSIGAPGDELAPDHLNSQIRTIYQQHNKPYCLTYSLASCLFYCGFNDAARLLSTQAVLLAALDFDGILTEIRALMPNLAPAIGLPTLYGIRTKRHSRVKRRLTWDLLFTDITPYPTIVIPVLPDGTINHAFCVVDDLIFDSSNPYALKLHEESVRWICNDSDAQIHQALRFNTKVSPPGNKIEERYTRPVSYHWENPHRDNHIMEVDDPYDIENNKAKVDS